MNDGFSFVSSITCSELFRVSWVHLGYTASDRRHNLKPKFAQVPEQSDFTYGVYLVAAEHLQPKEERRVTNEANARDSFKNKIFFSAVGLEVWHEVGLDLGTEIREDLALKVPCSY